jgi:NAD-dependent deacetylase
LRRFDPGDNLGPDQLSQLWIALRVLLMEAQPSTIPPGLLKDFRAAHRVAVLTGAGISAESGVPTFRDAQTGLWARFRPEDLATPEAFQRDPRLVWEWYEWRRGLVVKARPNPAHFALVDLEQRIPDFTLITQNVDGLHQQAGSRFVLELHGNIWRNKCFRENILVESWDNSSDEIPPRCPRCGAYLRPDVVWFGEPLPNQELTAAWETAKSCDLFFAIGTSGLVHPAASLPLVAAQAGAILVEINPNPTPLSVNASYHLSGLAGQVLPALIQAAFG